MKNKVETGGKSDRNVKSGITLLYETLLLVSDFTFTKPAAYAERIYELISLGLNAEEEAKTFEKLAKEDAPQAAAATRESAIEEID